LADPTKPLLRTLAGEALSPPPWWLMRQAGRYLPEYRDIRRRAGDFVELCLTPALAAELTLQPVRRFGMDAAILFSDILLLPWALGQPLAYREGEGPVLDPISDAVGLCALDAQGAIARLEPVFDAARRVSSALDRRTALIGFAGAPWTVATYMVEGGASRDFRRVKNWAFRDPKGFDALIALLTEGTIELLAAEIAAGAEAVQLFDTWAGVLPLSAFRRWVVEPTRQIVAGVKARYPRCSVIGFPRGAGMLYEEYAVATGVDAIGLDTAVPPAEARSRLTPRAALQGNLDPVLLLTGGEALDTAVAELRRSFDGAPWIFNLGHGVLPDTPPEHVAALADALTRPLA
jgi:uroporphyrinogen decarboxylase